MHLIITRSDSQRKDLEDNLADLYTSCEFVDRAIDNATPTQLLLVKKQVIRITTIFIVIIMVTVMMICRLESALVKLLPCPAFPLTLLMSLSGLIMITMTMMMITIMMLMLKAMMMPMMMLMVKVGGTGNSPVRSSNDGKSSQLLSHPSSLHSQ